MARVIDANGSPVYHGYSDAELVRWWQANGQPTDRLEDTGELMADVAVQLGLEP
jgi:hypothetical protein